MRPREVRAFAGCAELLRSCLLLSALASPAAAQVAAPDWFQLHDGPANYHDYGTDVVVDDAGNVYTTGFEFWSPQPGLFVPQMATLKHSPAGQLLWYRSYGSGFYGGNGNATHVALSPTGSVIVAGARDLGGDWVVLSYDPAGTQQWATIWQAGSWWVSAPEDLEIDGSGNIFLCGDFGDPVSFQTRAALVKLDAAGAIQWAKTYDGTGQAIETVSQMVLAPGGGAYLTGGQTVTNSSLEFSVAKVDAAGNPVWIRNHGALSLSANDYGIDVELAPNGDVVATGVIASNTVQGPNVTTIAYDANGVQLWRYDFGVPSVSEYPTDLAVDATGAALISGFFEAGSNDMDALVLKVANNQLVWSRTISGGAFLDDVARVIQVDSSGRATVAGERVDLGNEEIFVHQYDAAGTLVFEGGYPGPNGAISHVAALALDGGGAIAIAGDTYSSSVSEKDLLTAVFDPGGLSSYCTAGTSTLGCAGTISGTGTPSGSSGSGFTIAVTGMDGQRQGLIFYGVSGRVAVAWGPTSSFLCVKTPTQRTPVQNSGGTSGACNGALSLDWNTFVATHPAALGTPFPAGLVVDAQGWFRDPPSAKSTALSDGLEFVVQP